jgi:DNA-directed RNA polymerase beta' subunit
MKNIINFSALEIRIADPDTIKSWSYGEVKNLKQLITDL